jgi:predicted dehydrogenase
LARGAPAKVHAKSITEGVKGAELVAVVDQDTVAGKTVAERFHALAFSSLEQALGSARFEAVVIPFRPSPINL